MDSPVPAVDIERRRLSPVAVTTAALTAESPSVVAVVASGSKAAVVVVVVAERKNCCCLDTVGTAGSYFRIRHHWLVCCSYCRSNNPTVLDCRIGLDFC